MGVCFLGLGTNWELNKSLLKEGATLILPGFHL